jgi:hypothetical protein
VTGVKTAGMAARVLTATARVMDAVDPGEWAVKGSLAGIKVVVPSVVDLSEFLRGADIDGVGNTVPEIRIPDVGGNTLGWHPGHSGMEAPGFATPKLDAPTIDTPRLDAPGVATPKVDSPPANVPPVREPAPVGATPDSAAPVVREPATVGADRSPAADPGTTLPSAEVAPGGLAPDAPHCAAGPHGGSGDTQVLDHPTPHNDGSSTTTGHADGGTHFGADGPAGDGGRLDDASPPDAGTRLTETAGGDGWQPLTHEQIAELPVVRDGIHLKADGTLQPDTWYHAGEHEYSYHTNEHGHIDHVIAEDLHIKDHDGRLSHNLNTPGKLQGDHSGHLLADLFGGSPKLDNLVSQLSDINLSKFRKIEIQWADALRSDVPGTESVDMRIVTDPISGRPTRFDVNSIVNGDRLDRVFRQ